MNHWQNPSVAPAPEFYDPHDNPFGHGLYLEARQGRGLTFTDVIEFFDASPDGDFLSSFYPSPIRLLASVYDRLLWPDLWSAFASEDREAISAITFPTAEHAFQAFKSMTSAEFVGVAAARSPDEAKAAGRTLEMRPDWPEVRVPVMHEVLAQKFAQGSALGDRLLDTGTAILCEGNCWSDDLWGVPHTTGVGRNLLGTLLLERRGALRAMSMVEQD